MAMSTLFNKKIITILLFIFLAEILSFFGFLLPQFQIIIFFIIVLLILILSLYKFEYGILIILAELFIGSKGGLFYFEYDGLLISIRIALWLIIISVWASKIISLWIKEKKFPINYLKIPYWQLYLILFIFIGWGAINGFLKHNELSNIFFDFNGWLYFSLIFPIYFAFIKPLSGNENRFMAAIFQVFIASTIWLCLKTYFLLYVFSHNILGMVYELYRWVRNSGVGEITLVQGGFYRIFFQSHIFVLIGYFIFLMILFKIEKNKRLFIIYFLFFTLYLATILLSFSRSFWIGLAAGLFLFFLIILKQFNWKKFSQMFFIIIISGIFSILFIVAIVKFPYPNPVGGFSTADLLKTRVIQISGEAAVSSRWELLPELWQQISNAPILGKGFGATVTYKTNDPRILESSPDGLYTTYAFEWGWLDILLKLGIIGLLSYLILLGKVIYDGFKIKDFTIILGMTVGLFVIAIISFFSPYTNHPLGIGYLVLASCLITQNISYKSY
ncbi:MAG: O-antigen ligase family protein [Patescibacteria group bacterium]